MKNRMREFRSSGSARDGGGNVPIYSAMTPIGVPLQPALLPDDGGQLHSRIGCAFRVANLRPVLFGRLGTFGVGREREHLAHAR